MEANNRLQLHKFSPDRKYRYTLWRDWFEDLLDHGAYAGPPVDYVQFIGLNPSTADETTDDNTVTRCIRYAKAWGFNAMCMTNAFGYRATDPDVMKAQLDPIGVDNDRYLMEVAKDAKLVVACWGNHGTHMQRDQWIKEHIPNLKCLKISKHGNPWHPLYLKKTLVPIPFNP